MTTTKIVLTRDELLQPLQQVIGVVERKQTLPILSHVLLQFDQNTLSITGTDLEVELVGKTKLANAATQCVFTLPGRKLFDICRALPEESVIELTQKEGQVTLKAESSRFTLASLPANEFPNVENRDFQLEIKVKQKDLLALIQNTAFAMAQQDVRYYLNGMLFEATDKVLRAVATDGHRLATATIETETTLDHRLQIIAPRKGVLELARLLEDSEEFLQVIIGHNHFHVNGDDYTFISKLVEGRFPDYQRVIPKTNGSSIIINRNQLKQALNRAAILSNEKFRGIRFEILANTIKIQANNPEQESVEERVKVDYDGDTLDIGFNVNYLLDVLNTINTESIKLYFTNANSSVLVVAQPHDQSAQYVVMPMRL